MTSPARPATTRQAQELLRIGYRMPPVRMPPHKAEKYRRSTGRFAGKKGKRPSIKWIKENLSQAQAGLIFRTMLEDEGTYDRNEHRQMTKKERRAAHQIVIPERPFFGITENDSKNIITEMAKDMIPPARKK